MRKDTMLGRYGKYRVSIPERRICDGILFASRSEMMRYKQLKLLLSAKKIRSLQLQPKFVVLDSFTKHGIKYKGITYVGDFKYYDLESRAWIVEDVKGVETTVFKIKSKLFNARYNMVLKIIPISEI